MRWDDGTTCRHAERERERDRERAIEREGEGEGRNTEERGECAIDPDRKL
jgi:hypothetical protein